MPPKDVSATPRSPLRIGGQFTRNEQSTTNSSDWIQSIQAVKASDGFRYLVQDPRGCEAALGTSRGNWFATGRVSNYGLGFFGAYRVRVLQRCAYFENDRLDQLQQSQRRTRAKVCTGDRTKKRLASGNRRVKICSSQMKINEALPVSTGGIWGIEWLLWTVRDAHRIRILHKGCHVSSHFGSTGDPA